MVDRVSLSFVWQHEQQQQQKKERKLVKGLEPGSLGSLSFWIVWVKYSREELVLVTWAEVVI